MQRTDIQNSACICHSVSMLLMQGSESTSSLDCIQRHTQKLLWEKLQGFATYQEGLVELKETGELFEQLVDAVQPLQEDGTLLTHVVCVFLVATTIPKLMAKVQPFRLH